jgi:hypothetical protein
MALARSMKIRRKICTFIASLFSRLRKQGMAKAPIVDEREFLKLTRNHSELRDKLTTLGLSAASNEIKENAQHVALCWLKLAREHQDDAKGALALNRDRSVYSRSYYAAYNGSKSVRYVATGAVTLTGDDHKKASDLPDDFPDVAKWAETITKLYEHRLRADYDNWTSTKAELYLSCTDAVRFSDEFLDEAAKYLETKYGIKS